MSAAITVKVGGSLFDLPDLRTRLRAWLDRLSTRQILLVPGGGAAAKVVRELDRRHGLGEEASHWLALRAMSLNAWFLTALVPNSVVVADPRTCPALWVHGQTPILDALAFAHVDEGTEGALPHSWAVTSDSVAARAAIVLGGRQLILLKSVTIPEEPDWGAAGRQGWVDAYLSQILAKSRNLQVRAVNFRLES